MLPGSTFWNDWTAFPYSQTNWAMRPLGVQVLAIAYRSGEAWNESGYSNPEFDENLNIALATPDIEERKEIMKELEQILQESGIMIQPYWRKLYIHSVPSLKGHRMHPTLEHEFHSVWLDEEA